MSSEYSAKEIQTYFGEYTPPKLFLDFFNDQFVQKNISPGLGMYFQLETFHFVTPIDCITFAYADATDIHFAFLTDFGKNKDLSNAPIVCISPTDDPPIRVVAANLLDFFRVVLQAYEAENITRDLDSDQEYFEEYLDFYEITEEIFKNPISLKDKEEYIYRQITARQQMIEYLEKNYNISPMENISEYMESVVDARNETVNFTTADDLGVIFPDKDQEVINQLEYEEYGNENPEAIKSFLQKCNYNERLVFYRDVTYFYVIDKESSPEIQKVIADFLIKDGLKTEAELFLAK